ncbi:DNA-3-methyladenine glycosylase family protein [Ornithinimicrobium sediminis]|uniref:DNA-3-methyladenine glycosylase family protein n=1 Tax=Ornithinimicrobium sediminis TaxID=2904603 RepID=UPI001E4DD669|nr:DNA-3-methyladenine glycosylase 2 family protein [Ornithinimicrobium sediminis]MCE0486462.1 DNA-3-methyladenine glycosylase 2 family protein [Ornithinimicrobium sediminis]
MSTVPAPPTRSRVWHPGRPVDVLATWGTLRRGAGDPAWLVSGGVLWRALATPLGAVTLRVGVDARHERVVARAWGPAESVDRLLDALPRMLGADDDPAGFEPRHPVLERALRLHPGWRVPATGLVLEAMVPAVIEQKVTGQEAFGGQRRLVRKHGTPAPGPGAGLGLVAPPGADRLRSVASWEWLQLGVSPQRADTVMRVVHLADRLEELPQLTRAAARRRMTAVAGVGVWTAAETAQRALGDPDAVSFGDYHVARNIGWALTGVEVDDTGLAELLDPYRGHRYRVQRLLELVGVRRPRRGPRMAPRHHLPTR